MAPSAPRPAPSAPAKATERKVPSDDSVQPLVDRLQKARPLLAGYLSGAKTSRKEGNRVIWTFDDLHFAQPLIDAKPTLEELAKEVYGAPTQIVIETATEQPQGGRRAEDKPSPMREDPVVKAFAKHLGGEVVKEKR